VNQFERKLPSFGFLKPNRLLFLAICGVLICLMSLPAWAQSAANNSAHELVQQVINNELDYNQSDHSHWMYVDSYKSPGKDLVKLVIQTKEGTVSKTIRLNGRPLTSAEEQADQAKMESVVNDPAVREKQKKNSDHDNQQVISLMKMLPDGFIWTQTGESNGEVTLSYKPNPAFQPPTYASRVFAAMAGTLVVDMKQKRLKVFSGKLIRDVDFGWGLLGKVQQGGTFRVIHTEVAPGKWEITETHIHINGRILFFKSLVSQQEDEIDSHYKATPAGLTLRQAVEMLNDGSLAKEIGYAEEN
jgi:mannose-6-phosphate isomerase-like protein (cupin superfamily)